MKAFRASPAPLWKNARFAAFAPLHGLPMRPKGLFRSSHQKSARNLSPEHKEIRPPGFPIWFEKGPAGRSLYLFVFNPIFQSEIRWGPLCDRTRNGKCRSRKEVSEPPERNRHAR